MSQTPTASPPSARADGEHRHGRIGMVLVLFAQLMFVLDSTVVNVALPHIADDLDFGPAALSWVLDGYILAFGGLLLLGGRLGDLYGRLRLFWIGVSIFTVFSLVGGLAVDPTMLVVSRALQGVGAALAAPSVLALLTTNAPDEAARHRALAAFTAVSSGGGALGLILGGVLTDAFSWRWTLFINVPIGIVLVILVRRFLAETPRHHGRFDVIGAIAATGGAVSIVWAVVEAPTHGWGSVQTVVGFVVGVSLLAVLVVTETRVSHPLLELALLHHHARVASLVSMAGVYGSMLATFFLVVQVLAIDMHFEPLQAGLAFLPMPLCIFTLSKVTPHVVRRVSAVPMITVGTIGMTLSFLRLAQLDDSSGYWDGVFPSLLAIGISHALTFMPITSLALGDVDHRHAGAASGLLQTVQQLGGSMGLAAVASVFAVHEVPGDFLHGARAGFLAAAVLPAVALVSALTLAVRRAVAPRDRTTAG